MTIESFHDANMAILSIYTEGMADWTPFQNDKFKEILAKVIPPEKVSHFTEFAYAQADSLSTDAKQTASEIASFAATHGFYGLGVDQRGFRIAGVLRGDTVSEAPVPASEWLEQAGVQDMSAPLAIVPAPVPGGEG